MLSVSGDIVAAIPRPIDFLHVGKLCPFPYETFLIYRHAWLTATSPFCRGLVHHCDTNVHHDLQTVWLEPKYLRKLVFASAPSVVRRNSDEWPLAQDEWPIAQIVLEPNAGTPSVGIKTQGLLLVTEKS